MPDKFGKWGGRMSKKLFDEYAKKASLKPSEKEYVKKLYEKFDKDKYGISRDEFHKGLKQLAQKTNDPITKDKVEKLRKAFE